MVKPPWRVTYPVSRPFLMIAACHIFNPETKEIYEYIPYLAGQYGEAKAGGWADAFLDDLGVELQEQWNQEWELSFSDPELIGEVDIHVPAGDFRAFHVQDSLEWGIRMDYWISSVVPGGILAIHETQDDEDPIIIAELISVGVGYESRYAESDLIPIDAFTSKSGPRYLFIVFAFAGDSTITKDFFDKLDFAINTTFLFSRLWSRLINHESVIGYFHN